MRKRVLPSHHQHHQHHLTTNFSYISWHSAVWPPTGVLESAQRCWSMSSMLWRMTAISPPSFCMSRLTTSRPSSSTKSLVSISSRRKSNITRSGPYSFSWAFLAFKLFAEDRARRCPRSGEVSQARGTQLKIIERVWRCRRQGKLRRYYFYVSSHFMLKIKSFDCKKNCFEISYHKILRHFIKVTHLLLLTKQHTLHHWF